MRTGFCERCGEPFEDRSHSQTRRFCGKNCQQRAHEERHRAPCPECGTPMGVGSGSPGRPERCAACEVDHRDRTSNVAAAAALWYIGLTGPEIARELGTTRGAIGRSICRARERGWDVPYRYARSRNPSGVAR